MEIPEKKKKEKRYDGLHAKLIHLEPDTFNILETVAKMKGWNLKQYIEFMCKKQALIEAHEFVQKHDNQ